jgi:tetratricopeptide (TPR) repeat protein
MSAGSISQNHLQRAQKLIEVKRFSEAIPVLTKAITEDPQNYYAFCQLSFCFCQLEENEKCLEYAERAMMVDPEGEWAYRLKGIMLGRKGNRKAALEYAQKAVYFEPDNELALGNLVYAFLNNDKLNEARQVAEELLEISPDDAETHYIYGLVEKSSQNYVEAEKWFRQSLEITPNYAEARNMLAVTILKQSNTAKNSVELENQGLDHMLESVKIDPNNQRVIESIKNHFDNSIFYFAVIYLFPLFVLGLFVTPIVTILLGLFKLAILVTIIKENNNRYEKLTPELKNLLKVRNYAYYVGEWTAKFFHGGLEFLRMIWIQYVIALTVAFTYCYSDSIFVHPNFPFALKLLFWANLFWIFRRLVRYTAPPKQS